MRITITGTPGSGKSTLAKDISKALGMKFFSAGNMRRKMAQDRGMTLAEFNKLGETESWTDEELDNHVKKLGREMDDFVIEGRLAWNFVPDSIKIFLDADERLRAERIVPRKLKEESFDSVEQAVISNRQRVESDRRRYEKYYGIDPYDKSHYDIVLDSTGKTPKETLREAIEAIESLGNS